MLLECLNGNDLTVDGNPLLNSMRLNIAGNHQLRFKAHYYVDGNSTVPVDFIVLEYTTPHISLNSVSMDIYGVEKTRNQKFKLTIIFYFFKRKCHISGILLDKQIDAEFNNLIEILKVIGDEL